MADDVVVGNSTGGTDDFQVAAEELTSGAKLQSVELHTELAGTKTKVGAGNPLAVSGPATNAEIRATPVPVSGTVTAVTGSLTDTQLRASAVPVSGPLTDAELRATPVPVSGPLTDTQIRATALPVSGPLTDTQLRATPVPVSGTVAVTQAAPPSHPALTASAPAAATVGAASAEAVPVNASRKGLVLCNNSDNVISIAFGTDAVLNSGITLQPQGGTWTMSRDTFTTAQVRAIAGAGSSPLGVQEYV